MPHTNGNSAVHKDFMGAEAVGPRRGKRFFRKYGFSQMHCLLKDGQTKTLRSGNDHQIHRGITDGFAKVLGRFDTRRQFATFGQCAIVKVTTDDKSCFWCAQNIRNVLAAGKHATTDDRDTC